MSAYESFLKPAPRGILNEDGRLTCMARILSKEDNDKKSWAKKANEKNLVCVLMSDEKKRWLSGYGGR